MDELARQMYQEHILELFKHPHNFGKLAGATHKQRSFNPLCGDDITMQVIMKGNQVEGIKFEGRGCAISMAAASMLTDYAKGKTKAELMQMKKEDILGMLQIPIGPVRIKCALISLESLQKAVQDETTLTG